MKMSLEFEKAWLDIYYKIHGKGVGMSLDFEKAWLDVYYALEDNAMDSSRIMYLDDEMAIAGGALWMEVPF